MKILALSDLHLHFVLNPKIMQYYKNVVWKKFHSLDFDCIVITGDIFESSAMNKWGFNPYQTLRWLFDFTDVPIICCLGNHEFAYNKVQNVLTFYRELFVKQSNVYYLDVCDKFDIQGCNFVGNVLFYDNTLGCSPYKVNDFIVKNWLDSTIIDFVPSIECIKRKEQIKNNIDDSKINILLTHCVPHWKLNWFETNQPNSTYNQYSGCKDFLNQLSCINLKMRIMELQ